MTSRNPGMSFIKYSKAFPLVFLLTSFWTCRKTIPSDAEYKLSMPGMFNSFTAHRAYPTTSYNVKSFTAAYQKQKLSQIGIPENSTPPWRALGPKNFAGRCLTLALNPLNNRCLYVGTAGAGLWKSTSLGKGAQAWQHVNTNYPIMAVSAIAIHPSDSNTIYIGTGEVYNYGKVGTGNSVWRTRGSYGIGILKTEDGGISWKPSLDWQKEDLRGINKIVIDHANNEIIIAASSEGVYRTEDHGQSWQEVLSVKNVTDLLQNDSIPSLWVASAGNLQTENRGIYSSSDNGISWTKVGQGFPDFTGKTMLVKDKARPHRVVASVGGSRASTELYESRDFGLHWSPIGMDLRFTYYWIAHDVSVHPKNAYEIVCAGVNVNRYNRLSKTINGRSRWNAWYFHAFNPGEPEGDSIYVHADIHDILRHPDDNNHLYFATDGGVFRSLNHGATYEGCNGGLQTTQFYPGCSNSFQDSAFYIGGLQDNATTVYEGGPAWRKVIGGDGGYTAVDPLNDSIVYSSVYWMRSFLSRDKAFSYSEIHGQKGFTQANFIAPIVICPNDASQVAIAGSSLVISMDHGKNWQLKGLIQREGKMANTLCFDPHDCQRLYAGLTPFSQGDHGEIKQTGKAAFLRSDDLGENWQLLGHGLPDRVLTDLAINPDKPGLLYGVLSGFGSDHVFKSVDFGVSWTSISEGLPDVPFNTIIVDPLNTDDLYAGCDIGVYASRDAGLSWVPYAEGLPEATLVMDLSISPVNRKLRIGTHGRGAWERDLLFEPIHVATNRPNNPLNLQIFPNPAQNITTIHANGQIVIYASNGLIQKKLTVKKQHRLDISTWSPGVYFISYLNYPTRVRRLLKI